MKTEKNKLQTFGELIAAVYGAWGKQKARAIVRLAVNGGVIEFPGRERIVISDLNSVEPRTMKKLKNSPSKSSGVLADGKQPTTRRNVRLSAREVLCSFPRLLTERERMVLGWLADGLSVSEIAERLRIALPVVIECHRQTTGGARSLSPGSAQKSFSGSRPSSTPQPSNQPAAGPSEANASRGP